MKAHGKGLAFIITEPNTGGTSILNAFKMELNKVPPPTREWKAYKPEPHPRQADMEMYRAIPSKWTK